MKQPSHFFLAFVAAVILVAPSARAFPPAPPKYIYGLVRDQWGDPINLSSCQVVLQSQTGVTIAANVVPYDAPGVNYRLTIPLDPGTAGGAYQKTALPPNSPVRLLVIFNGATNVPIEMMRGFFSLGKPLELSKVDLTLGNDSIGDGLPDEWKNLIVQLSGGLINFGDIHPNSTPPWGGGTYRSQFIAGSFPWDPSDAFRLNVVRVNGGAPRLQFPVNQGRVYTLFGSADMQTWTPLKFQLPFGAAGQRNYFQATDYDLLQVDVVAPTNQPAFRFFRSQVQ